MRNRHLAPVVTSDGDARPTPLRASHAAQACARVGGDLRRHYAITEADESQPRATRDRAARLYLIADMAGNLASGVIYGLLAVAESIDNLRGELREQHVMGNRR